MATSIGFVCLLCDGCFSIRLDYVPEGAVIGATCPHCMNEIELSVDDVTAQIINLEEVRQLRQ